MTNKRTVNVKFLAELALLVAIQIMLVVTPVGFITIGIMTITIVHIPVLVGTFALGPKAGLLLGGVFGLSSMITATVRATPDSIVFSPFLSGSLLSVVISMVPRLLFPLIAYLLFKLLLKTRLSERLAAGIAATVGSLVHTVLVLACIYFLLGQMYAQNTGIGLDVLLTLFIGVIGTNGILEALAANLFCAVLVPPLRKIATGSAHKTIPENPSVNIPE